MTNEQIIAYQRAWKEFTSTEIGRLFISFENKLSRAWQIDTQASFSDSNVSDKRLSEAWETSNSARKAFLKAIGFEEPSI